MALYQSSKTILLALLLIAVISFPAGQADNGHYCWEQLKCIEQSCKAACTAKSMSGGTCIQNGGIDFLCCCIPS